MSKKHTVLVVDDNEVNRKILCRILKKDYHILQAENGQQALDLLSLNTGLISAILLDIMMPVMDGYSVLKKLNEDPFLSSIPVIVMTGNSRADVELKALSLGAHDFLTKPYNPSIIKHRLANTIKLVDTAALINSIQTDELTGVLNKEFFYRKAATMIHDSSNQPYDLICTDIERFKLINDLFGTKVGDELLHTIAKTLTHHFGSSILCGRIGGDKFACLVPHEDLYKNDFFEQAVAQINDGSLNVVVNISFGIFTISDLEMPISAMCDRALLACNSIKGKYGVHFAYYDNQLRQALLAEQSITTEMKAAIDKGQFHVYYQPKYDIASEKVVGAEALVRWIHPQKGVILPNEFIPLFEKNGFITELDLYLWDLVCQDLSRWIKAKQPVVPISVNVSRADIYRSDLIDILINLTKKYNLEPSMLHLEVTETAYTENSKQLIWVLTQLKKLGFVIEMDDFGSGYSSLNMLSELPIDILKLDMRFIQDKAHNKNSAIILSFVTSLAKWLNLPVVAEGVETKEQVIELRNMDCTYIQGYYFAKPMNCNDFEAHIKGKTVSVPNKEQSSNLTPVAGTVNQTVDIFKSTMMIVDDVELNRCILSEIFSNSYNIVQATNGKDAYTYILSHYKEIDIIILDLIMPIMDGFLLLKKLKGNTALQNIPVVITSQADERNEIRAFSLGAADFLAKPYNKQVALHRIKNVMAEGRLSKLEEQNALFKKMREMELKAKTDGLTGLYNRTEFETQVTAFFHNKPAAQSTFIILDIDNFKLVNDRLGHSKGDEAIQKVAAILKTCFRDNDFISRLGGDEFSIFINSQLSKSDLNARLSKLCTKLKFVIDEMNITCSIGACVSPAYGKDYQTLYQNADIALLTAKRLGKNQYQIFGGETELPSHVLFRNMDWLMDEASDAVIVCDTENYELLYLNNVACQIAGKSKRACLGKTCYEVLWNRTQPCTHCVHIDKLTKDYCEHEANPEGTNRSFIIKGKFIDWGGTPARIQYIQDNTDKAAIAKQLSDISKDRKRLLDFMPGGVFRYRADDKAMLDFVSENMLTMLGYTRKQFEQKFKNTFPNLIWHEDRQRVLDEISRQIQVGNTDECEYRIEKQNGELCWVHDVGHLVEDEDGGKWFYVTIIDVTQSHAECQKEPDTQMI